MRIAQISPLHESVPPRLYGGTERVVSYLTEELVRAGHEVTLFASGDSRTSARLVPLCESALRLNPSMRDPAAHHFLLMEKVLKYEDEFDIIHSHIDYIGFVLGRRSKVPVVSTMHGRLDYPEHGMMLEEYCEQPIISISNAQRRPVPNRNWLATVYHGLPGDLYSFNANGGGYLAFVGRISPEKKVDTAIEIAMKTGMPLKIAAKVDKADADYFEAVIKHKLDHPLVEFLGELGDRDKEALAGGAAAFLHPVDWPEPFGLSMIEAMACGTPVIARRRGSIPEVVDHGITGYIFERVDEAVSFIKEKLPALSRKRCREWFEKRFLARRMTREYLSIYESIVPAHGKEEKCLRLAG